MFDPVVRWLEQRLGVSLRVDDNIMGAEQGPEAIQAVRHHLSGDNLRDDRRAYPSHHLWVALQCPTLPPGLSDVEPRCNLCCSNSLTAP